MAIDKKRLREYLKEMKALEGRVTENNFIRRFEEKLLDLLSRNQIDTDDLTFIRNEVEKLFKSDFSGFDTKIKQTYNDIIELINELYDDIGTDVTRKFQRIKAVEQANQLQLQGYEEKTIESIARTVRQGIVEDVDFKELTRRIKKIGGTAGYYAETLAGTQLKRFARISKYNKSLIANVEYFTYAGVLRETTRSFCRACLLKTFHINNILKMRNGNLEPVIINCGGWNCIHDWEPDPFGSRKAVTNGKWYNLEGGARIYGDQKMMNVFNYSQSFETVATKYGVGNYLKKIRDVELTENRINHIRRKGRYADISDHGMATKIGHIRNNPDKVYYQYNKGPGLVFVKDGECAFIDLRKVKTLFKPTNFDKYKEFVLDNCVDISHYD